MEPMRKLRFLRITAFLVLLALVTGPAFALFSENSRQGGKPVSVTSHQVIEPPEPGLLPGLALALLELAADSLFSSKDPIGFQGGPNLYRYGDNNPLAFTDPYGLIAGVDDLAFVALVSSLSGLTVAYLNSPSGQAVISDFKGFIDRQCRNAELTYDTIIFSWDSFIHFAQKGKGRQRGDDLADVSDEDVEKGAREGVAPDGRQLSGEERRKYIREDKARKNRNRKKRNE